ncbi:hypothetical protein [Polaribacter sp.]|uniref:hypothetical protein n=1 Tax=Polaribacter sp. TaxID=1920175 RepID=UPI0040486861
MDFTGFDSIDAFMEPIEFRLQGLNEGAPYHNTYAIFLRNYCNRLFYNNRDSLEIVLDFFLSPSDLFKRITEYGFESSFLTNLSFENFAQNELKAFTDCSDTISKTYTNFIYRHLALFKKLDALCSQISDHNLHKDGSFSHFLRRRGIDADEINTTIVNNTLVDFEKVLCAELFTCLVHSMNFDPFNHIKLLKIIKSLKLELDSPLVLEASKQQLQQHAMLWIQKKLDTLMYVLELEEKPSCFVEIIQYVEKHLPFTAQSTPHFPTEIFASYEGYLLFDTVAKGVSTHKLISYLYRMLFEKGMIKVEDTPFRNWFNGQDYLIKIKNHTDTLANSKTTDREQLIGVIAGVLGVEV